ncbi:MAG: recombinase family protein [Cyanobacteria bacterium]|nr:recombinase family protein [Cyanobacteriota bacterium]
MNAQISRQWIVGTSLSGKTSHLLTRFQTWSQQVTLSHGSFIDLPSTDLSSTGRPSLNLGQSALYPRALVLSAIGDNRLVLTDRLTTLTQSKIPFRSTTPLGFFEEEVLLFWPLLVKNMGLTAQFPVRLRPENEQELATRFWRSQLDMATGETGIQASKLVRRLLDIYQLAAFSETRLEEIPAILKPGIGAESPELVLPTDLIGTMLLDWRSWCLERGFLNYGLLTELYAQHLLPDAHYQLQLPYRIQAVFADDVDEYPPVMRSVFQQVLTYETPVVCTFNPNGGIRLGLGADPVVMEEMAEDWDRINLSPLQDCCFTRAGDEILDLVTTPLFLPPPIPSCIQTIQTTTRAQLLRQTATIITGLIKSGEIRAQDIAIVAPGFDPISRYALTQMLTSQGIRVKNLNEQRPLTSVPLVRSLLTLLTLVYPNLGRLITRDGISEMLVVLNPKIDPVRSGLLTDHCFEPHPDRPRLLPSKVFERWDRLGYDGMTAYEDLIAWIAIQQEQLAARLLANPIVLLDRAIQKFFLGGVHLPFEQVASLRELLDTAQHYWEVETRIHKSDKIKDDSMAGAQSVRSFIQLLRSGAVTANPYPVQAIGSAQDAVTIASVFQYRLNRESHSCQFWFDAGGSRWLTGVDALFASPLFLSNWSGTQWETKDTLKMNEQRLIRIVRDLLERSSDRIILCHSDLATSGQEQLGPLLSIVTAAAVNDG